jgi:hypothetical protein
LFREQAGQYVVLMSEPQDPLCVAVGDLLPVAAAERGPLDAGHGIEAGLVGVTASAAK